MNPRECQVEDVCGHTHILRGLSLEELHGRIGPRYPVILDGAPGFFTVGSDDGVRFVAVLLN